jgi:hypothetical protein
MHAALDRAAILAARDHFLPGIAAFLKVHATHQLEIDHLRYEPLCGRRHDAWHTAQHVEQLPRRRIDCRQGWSRLAARLHQQPAPRTLDRWQSDEPSGISRSHVPRRYVIAQVLRSAVSGQPEDRPRIAQIVDAATRTQHEHREALAHGGRQIGAAQHRKFIGCAAPDDEAGEQPTFGRAIAAEARFVGRQIENVLRQLPLQERRSIGAVRAQQRPIGQTHAAVDFDGDGQVVAHDRRLSSVSMGIGATGVRRLRAPGAP